MVDLSDLPAAFRERNRDALAAEFGSDHPSLPRDPSKPLQGDVEHEKQLQGDSELTLHRLHIRYLHLSPRAREKKGWPDLTFVVNGYPLAVELKSATGTVSDEQTDMLTGMRENGWHCYVLRNYKDFWHILDSYMRKQPGECEHMRWEPTE